MRRSQADDWIQTAVILALALAAIGAAPSLARGQTAQQSRYIDFPEIVVEYDVQIPMRDGVHLSADIYRPRDAAVRAATVMQLTPYNNNADNTMAQAWQFVRRGYAYVTVDARGRYDSEGDFFPFRADGPDGSDVIRWIARQSWSNGKVATMGASYGGMNQWLMAKEANPHHAAILAYVAPADGFHDLVRYNGIPKPDLIFTWMMGMDGRVNQSRTGWDWNGVMTHLPLNTMDAAVGRNVLNWRHWMENDRLGGYWEPVQMRGAYERFDIPSFNVSGWFDGQLRGAVRNYEEAVRTGRVSDHMLVIGPWLHGVNRNRRIGERDYGPEAIIDLDGLRDAWLDHRMLGRARSELPNVLYFLPVRNEWRAAEAWPVPGTRFMPYYLDSQGNANTLLGDGRLRTDGAGSGRADEFTYDPANPVPTVSSRTSGARGGLPQGSVDNRAVETRQDVLVYTSEPLAEGVEVTGPVKAVIHFSTDVPDTDITVKLLDVHADGRAHNISHGVARARYRNSYAEPELLKAGEVYAIEVELFPTSNYFEAGHRIRIEVSSSDFPNFARNLNTAASSDTGTEMRVARTKIHHSRRYPSQIVLPVVPAGASRRWTPGRPVAVTN